jgi:hypothetical protein
MQALQVFILVEQKPPNLGEIVTDDFLMAEKRRIEGLPVVE